MFRPILLSSLLAIGSAVSSCSAVGQGNLCNVACASSCRGYAPYYTAGCLDDSTCANPPSGATLCTCGTAAPTTRAPTRTPTSPTTAKPTVRTTVQPTVRPSTATTTVKPSIAPTTVRPSTAPPASTERNVTARITGYGAPDNCPPGPVDSNYTGGDGSYNNPITTATTYAAVAQGTRIYVTQYQKYFIVDDTCTECDDDWKLVPKVYHFDLWVGPSMVSQSSVGQLGACEVCLSSNSMQVIINPKSTYPVKTAPLFNTATNACSVACSACVDDAAHTCGNICAADANGCQGLTCAQCATKMLLTTTKFLQLNSFCAGSASTVISYTDVCQAGSCGYPQ